MKECATQNNQEINFVKEDSRKKWELLEKARAICDTIPFDDSSEEDIQPIHFDVNNRDFGLLISLVTGRPPLKKDGETVYVPRRTKFVLEKLEIPYNEGFPSKSLDLSELTQWDY